MSEAEVMAMVKTAVAASVAGLRAVVVEMEEKVAGVREVAAAEEYLEEGSCGGGEGEGRKGGFGEGGGKGGRWRRQRR